MSKDTIVVALDIGSSKFTAVVASVDEKNKVSVIGTHTQPSKGIKNGVVNNIDKAVEGISEVLNKAEMMSGHPISSVSISISGTHIESLNSHGVVAVSGDNSEISEEDLYRVDEAARAISLPSSRQIIHVIPREYIIDKQRGIIDPIGMSGVRLEVEANIIHGSTTAIKNIVKCINQVGIEVNELFYSGLASAEAVLTDTEKELGTVLLDIGGGTIDIVVYEQGRPVYSAVLPIGGQDITNDIAIGLRTLLPNAEKIKIRLSTANEPKEGDDFIVDKRGKSIKLNKGELYLGNLGVDMETVSKKVLNDIISKRLRESFKFVQLYLKKAGYADKLPAGVVITGGTARIKGIEKIAEDVFKLPTRIGTPVGVAGLIDQIQSSSYSSVMGMILSLANDVKKSKHSTFRNKKGSNGKSIFVRIVDFIKSFLP